MNSIIRVRLRYFKNRRRFNKIISDRRFPYLIPIFDRLFRRDRSLTDEEILVAYYKFSKSMQSNSFAIAELELVIVSFICGYRHHLSEKLLEKPIGAIIASLGELTDYNGVIRFIDDYLLTPNAEPYGGLPPNIGIEWLKQLKSQRELFESVLKRITATRELTE